MSKLESREVRDKLKGLRGWEVEQEVLTKTYSFDSVTKALDFINQFALSAEHGNWYPQIVLQYNKVTIYIGNKELDKFSSEDWQVVKTAEQLASVTI